jgi:hypothetical protein
VDINSLLNNPAILQALQSQNSAPAPVNEPPSPAQTTRFGRVSRPPVVEQESLAILQQILAGQGQGKGQGDGYKGSSSRPDQRQAGQSASAPRVNSKRPHSTLRESSIPRSRSPNTSGIQSPPLQMSEQPLVRPQQPSQGGRPRRGEAISKEERAERRRVQNSLSGMSTYCIQVDTDE